MILPRSTCNNAKHEKQPKKMGEKRTWRKKKRRVKKGGRRRSEGINNEKEGKRGGDGVGRLPRGRGGEKKGEARVI